MRSSLKMAAYEARNRAEGGDMRMEGRGYAEGNEAAFRDGRGRRRYDDGRFAPRNEMEGRMESRYEMDGDMESRRRRMTYDESSINEPIPIWRGRNPIGFSAEMTGHHGGYGKDGGVERGRAGSSGSMGFGHEEAEKWMRHLKNADGSTGAHWPFDHVKQVMEQKKIDCDPMDMWLAVNMMYSDYYPLAKSMGMDNIGFYVEMAKCFLDDEDAVKDKLAAYYRSVVKH